MKTVLHVRSGGRDGGRRRVSLTASTPAALTVVPSSGRPSAVVGRSRARTVAVLRHAAVVERQGVVRHLPQPERGFADGLRVLGRRVGHAAQAAHAAPLQPGLEPHVLLGRTRVVARGAGGGADPQSRRDGDARPTRRRPKLRGIDSYAATFGEVFPKSGVTMGNIARALSAFERTIVTHDSPADRYAAGETSALDERGRARPDAVLRARPLHHLSQRAELHRRPVPQHRRDGRRPRPRGLRSGGRVPDAAVPVLSDETRVQDPQPAERRAHRALSARRLGGDAARGSRDASTTRAGAIRKATARRSTSGRSTSPTPICRISSRFSKA